MSTAILEFKPLLNHDNVPELTKRDAAVRAVNQLLSVVVGGRYARQTDNLKHTPGERVRACIELAGKEYLDALASLKDNPDNQRLVNQVQRKMDSLNSLATISNLIEECEW